ncbi:hypothetical protein [Embleya sp. NPDC050493]|uniref:hypothetical protein n=1 Tax=Embleya sp. NPDC050493 TaxID=3363989 RepID=UPI0037A54368
MRPPRPPRPVWQARDRQEWDAAIRAALAPGRPVSTSAGGADAAFAPADPDLAVRVLTGAGFTAVDVVDVHEPVYYGPDADHAHASVLRLQMARELLADLDAASAARARDRLRATLDAHDTGDGVRFASRAWLIAACRP